MDQKRWLFALFVTGCSLLAMGWLLTRRNMPPTEGTTIVPPPPVVAFKPSFAPEQVIEFKWTVGEKSFDFKRHDLNSPWLPSETAHEIPGRLKALSEIHRNEIEGTTADFQGPLVRVDLKLNDGTVLGGYWTPRRFLWDVGPLHGKGSILDAKDDLLFLTGRYTFSPENLDLCGSTGKVLNVNLTVGANKWTVSKLGDDWTGLAVNEGKPPRTKKIEPVDMDAWTATFCRLEADEVIDPKLLADSPGRGETLEFETSDHQVIRLAWNHDDMIQIIKPGDTIQMLVTSEALNQVVQRFKTIVDPLPASP